MPVFSSFPFVPGADRRAFAPGEWVTIISLTGAGRPIIEGRAVVHAKGLVPNTYAVRFIGESRLRVRAAHRATQASPEALTSIMFDIWQAAVTTPLEFFPAHDE